MSSKSHVTTNHGSTNTAAQSSAPSTDTLGNSARQDLMNTPTGRVYHNIIEVSGGDPSLGFSQQDLREYLKSTLGFAEGEMFRGTKINGGAEAMFEELDVDKDGKVNWADITGLTNQMVEMLIPGASAEQFDEAEIRRLAEEHFSSVSGSEDGQLTLAELKKSVQQELPADTNHKSLTAQLAARLAIDAIDRDESSKAVGERSISKEEWVAAALEMAASIGANQ